MERWGYRPIWGKHPIPPERRGGRLIASGSMIPFLELRYRAAHAPHREGLRPFAVALVLALLLCFQVGLVIWITLGQRHP